MRDLKFQHGEGWPKAGMKPAKLIDGRTLIRSSTSRSFTYSYIGLGLFFIIFNLALCYNFSLGFFAEPPVETITDATDTYVSKYDNEYTPWSSYMMMGYGGLFLLWGLFLSIGTKYILIANSGVKVLKRGLFSGATKVVREVSAQEVESVAVRNMKWGNGANHYGMTIALRNGKPIKLAIARCANSSAEAIVRATAKDLGVRRVMNWDDQPLENSRSTIL